MQTYNVFISYRRSDEGIARSLASLLTMFGQRVFLDVSCIPLGVRWELSIQSALQSAETMLVLWSKRAAQSTYMPREWASRAQSCRIVPILLDDSPLPEELAQWQATQLQLHEVLARRIGAHGGSGKEPQVAVDSALQEIRTLSGNPHFDLSAPQRQAALRFAKEARGSSMWTVIAGVLGWLLARSSHALMRSPAVPALFLLGGFGAGKLDAPTPAVPPPPASSCDDVRACDVMWSNKTDEELVKIRDTVTLLDRHCRRVEPEKHERPAESNGEHVAADAGPPQNFGPGDNPP